MKHTKKRNGRGRHAMQHRASMILISAVILVLGATLFVASISLQAKNNTYKAQEAELEAALEAEKMRAEEIAELEEYVGTDKYVEDVAKEKLGLVYPNEIIFEAEP